jgi:tetratricopeptide (TPR) repeat protein
MRVAKSQIPRHLLSAFLLASSPGSVMAQQPAPPAAPAAPVAPATLNRLFNEAEKAFTGKEYATAVEKLGELIKALNNAPNAKSPELQPTLEMLHFNVGLAHLLGGNFADAEKAFEDCANKFPKGEYTSRCYLGIGRAAMEQGDEAKRPVAIEALKKAAADPKFRTEAGLSLGQVYIASEQHEEALKVFRSLMGSDIRTPQQTAAAVEVIGLLADTGQLDDLVIYLDRLIAQPGVRDAIAWYANQVIVKGDAMVQGENFEAALAIYRSIPPREQILQIQAVSLDSMRKERDLLDKRMKAEEKKGIAERSNVSELLNMADASLKLNEEAKKAIDELEDLDAALLMRRGRCFYYLLRREEALLCFRTLREKYPKATDAQNAAYAEIILYNELKDTATIRQLANDFLVKYPDAPNIEQVATLAGEVLVQTGKWDEVLKFYEDLAAKFPQSPSIDRFSFYQAVSKFQLGEFLPSAEMLEKFIKDYPNSQLKEAAMYRIAMAYFFSNKYKETLHWCREYLNTYPDGRFAGDMLYRLAFIDSNDKEVDQSKNIIDNLGGYLEKHPEDLAAGSMLTLMADTWKKMKPSDPDDAEKTATELKNYEDEALKCYIKAVWSNSPDDVIQYAMDSATSILQARKDWQGIADLHGKFLKEKPDHQMALMGANWVSKAMGRLGKPEEGAAILSDVMAKSIGDPDKEQVEFLISEIVKSMVPRKRTPEMAEELDAKLTEMLNKAAEGKESPTTNARIYYGRAQLALLMRDQKRAESYLTGIATDTNIPPDALSPALLTACADILLKTGDLDRAEEMFRRLSDKYKESGFSDAGPVGMGQVALARKEPQKALEIFDDALTNIPGMSRFKEATYGKLVALRDLEKYDEAEALALQIAGDRSFRGSYVAKAYMILADVLRKKATKQDTKGSIETLKKAHGFYQRVYVAYQKEPEICAEAYWGAYETAKDLGDTKLAAETLKQLKEHPKLKDTEYAKKALSL